MQMTEFTALLHNVKGNNGQFTALCPAHKDKQNSLSVGTGRDGRILLKCHAGCTTQAVLQALGLPMDQLFADASAQTAKKTAGVKGKPLRDAPMEEPFAFAKRAHSEVRPGKCKFEEIVYPYHGADGQLLFETVRRQHEDGSKSFRQRRHGSKGELLYNLQGVEPVLYRLPEVLAAIGDGRELYLCEGEKDADALAALGFAATTAPMGAGKWRPAYTEALAGARVVCILPDHDVPGHRHALQVAESLGAAGIACGVVDLAVLCPALPLKGDVTDVLEAMGSEVADRFLPGMQRPEAFAQASARWQEAQEALRYRFPSALAYLQEDFWGEISRMERESALTTGFAGLDAQLGGRLYAGLYVVGSVSSLGKTAFCLQMADHLAETGVDVLFFTLEMSRAEMVARSLTRHLFAASGFKSEAGVGDVLYGKLPSPALQGAVNAYEEGAAGHIAFFEAGEAASVKQVAAAARRHKEATGRTPVVFVDYLQILAAPDVRMSDKQATDHNILALKSLSRELDTPVFAVSSFNRQNYADEVNMASFKESGAIEYSADFVLGLQPRGLAGKHAAIADEKRAARMVRGEIRAAMEQTPRPLEAVTLKNRRGPAYVSFGLDFYPAQNYFHESKYS